MKLRRFPVSLNGNRLDPDQFGYDLHTGMAYTPEGVNSIRFPCRGGKFEGCVVKLTLGPPDQVNARWHWDGNMDEPTVTPSIGCDNRCGWHGHIIKGEVTP